VLLRIARATLFARCNVSWHSPADRRGCCLRGRIELRIRRICPLRINHEPLLPSAIAPLHLVPDNVAPPTVRSGRPSPASEPEIATTVADESAPENESAPHDGGETQSSARSDAEPEALASGADEKTQAAAQPADPPKARSTALVADDHSSDAAEP
jgi:hypothetical protein